MSQKEFLFLKIYLEGNEAVLGDFGCILQVPQNYYHLLDSKKAVLERGNTLSPSCRIFSTLNKTINM